MRVDIFIHQKEGDRSPGTFSEGAAVPELPAPMPSGRPAPPSPSLITPAPLPPAALTPNPGCTPLAAEEPPSPLGSAQGHQDGERKAPRLDQGVQIGFRGASWRGRNQAPRPAPETRAARFSSISQANICGRGASDGQVVRG